jgi:hypothetical protein
MKRCNGLVLIAALAAGYGAGLVPGRSSVEEVRAAMGAPTLVRELPDGGSCAPMKAPRRTC